MIPIKKAIIAKSGKSSNEWLPLWMHLRDTLEIMKILLDEFVSDSFAESCGLSKKLLIQIAIFIAYIHDIGKATVGFQYKIGLAVTERIGEIEYYGLKLPAFMETDRLNLTPHALAGEVILRYYGFPNSIAAIVGAHHGVPLGAGSVKAQELNQREADIKGFKNYFGCEDDHQNRELLEEIWKSLIDDALKYSQIESIDELPEISSNAQMILTGLLIMADWIASNTEYFPLISVDDTGDESYYTSRVENAWEKISFPEMWSSLKQEYSDFDFRDTFGFIPRSTQKAMLDIVAETQNPGLFILEAPMGCGKTEAALAASELLAAKLKKKGVFFGLPTQATANGLFPRVINWAEKQSEEFYHSVNLKHGGAELNKIFKSIQKGIPEEKTDSGLIVHSWFCDKKACLADFVVGTVDQLLMAALKRKHVMLLHLGLAEKVVVIDEVHAYDAYMNEYLERALQWLGKYHTPVILLSATLPAQRRMALVNAYLSQKESSSEFEANIDYPLLTWTDDFEIQQKSLPYNGSHQNIETRKIKDDEIISIIKNAVDSGGCVGVIVNTVSRAQKIYDSICTEITDNVLLYHAQFIMPDRNQKEAELIDKVGKKSSQGERKGFVVVGTQVLEQSLDIDFDVLITDICPMDLLLQRIGRLHRHERDYRPDILKGPVCYVVTDEYDNEKTGSRSIYGEWLLKETLEFLPETIMIPDDVSTLVQKVYSFEDDSEEYKKYEAEMDLAKSRADKFLIKRPSGKDIHGILDKSIETKDDNKAEASVRDGISSIEVLLMKRLSDGTITFIDGTIVSSELRKDECERIAEQKVRLPSKFSQKWNIDNTIEEIENNCRQYIERWQESYLLKGKLVLFLDENMETELMNYKLSYSFQKGLISEKE